MTGRVVTRREVRHGLLRAHNERVAASRDLSWPTALVMHPLTREDVLIDDDPAEAHVVDFEGHAFMSIPVLTDDRLERGVVQLQWPTNDRKVSP